MYKLSVDPSGFLNISQYSAEGEEYDVVVPRIQDPFSEIGYLSVFRNQEYQLFHVKSASKEELSKPNESAFFLYWVQLENGHFIQWDIDIQGRYISQKSILAKEDIKALWSNLIFSSFPGYLKIVNRFQGELNIVDSLPGGTSHFIERNIRNIRIHDSMMEYFLKAPDLYSLTVTIPLKDYEALIKSSSLTQDALTYIGDVEIYKEILKKGDTVYFDTGQRLNEHQSKDWKSIDGLLTPEEPRGHLYQALNMVDCQNNIKYSVIRLLTGYAWCKCPFTGNILKSNKSFLLDLYAPYVAYYFESIFPFFLISYGGWSGNNYAIYLPIPNICIQLNSKAQWSSEYVIQKLVENFNRYQTLISEYLVTENKNKCLLVGTTDNLGHYIWQDLSGISLLFDETNLSENIEHYLVDNRERYAEGKFSPEVIFPELRNIHRFKEHDGQLNRTEIALKSNLFLFKVEDIVVSNFLVHRIHAVANRQSFDLLEELTQAKNKGAKILLINLRVHNKIWVNAAQVLSEVFNSLNNDDCDVQSELLVLYDGFKDTKTTIDLIREKTTNTYIRHFDCTELTIVETCAVVSMIDAFICTIGSGLVIPTWIYNKPGIAHGDKGHLAQKTMWQHVTPSMFDSKLVTFLDEKEIEPLDNNSYGNYRLHIDLISNKIRDILKL
jgi:hypothetical protein